MSARESASFARDLRFVLSLAEYEEAVWMIEHNPDAADVLRRLELLGRGSLTLEVTDYRMHQNPSPPAEWARERFAWITVSGRACVPTAAAARRRNSI
jgi:hypothetical protein